jgi:pyruvate/2-oxoglutarate dehydrogenase complex dihydrolipoamide dehydrogenase (E3) component
MPGYVTGQRAGLRSPAMTDTEPLIAPFDEHNQRLLAHVHPDNWKNPEPAPVYDLVVIGGGTAGLVCAAGAAGLGARVALVERALLGGDCLNTGCVPSKALLRSARAVHEARTAAAVGVRTTVDVDFAAVMTRLRTVRADIAHNDSAARFASLGVDVFLGQASFVGPRVVAVDAGSERTRPTVAGLSTAARLRFRRAVIATGARPADHVGWSDPAAPGIAYFTSETIFSLTTQPRHLLIIGAGPIGCEMAQAFALLGSRVTLVDSAPRVLSGEDEDASRIIATQLERDGVTIVMKVGELRDLIAAADAVLVATGRTPNVEGLNLEAAGIHTGPAGIQVDDRLRTSNHRVYAAGDVCSRFKFTHAADAMARIVIQNALFFGRRRASALVIPWCTYTCPEVAHVGVSSGQAITIPLAEVDRAIVDAETDGFVRIHHEQGRIIGATIVAAHAGELIGHVADVMRRGGSVGDLSAVIFPYPTVAEALRKAGDTYRRQGLTPRVRRLLEYYFRVTRH